MPSKKEQPVRIKGKGSRLSPEAIEQLYKKLSAARPDARTELNYTTPYTLLVAVVLSAQMTDKGVNRATEDLFKTVTTPQQMIDLGEDGVRKAIAGVNFNNTKAKNVMALSRVLVDKFDGQIPRSREDLEALPGVGRKTANVVLNEIYREPTLAVDTHVFRVANRTGLAPGATPLDVELTLLDVTPKRYLVGAHHWLILHGRYTCLARAPLCSQCPIFDLCLFTEKELYALKMAPKTKPAGPLKGSKR